jgi:hypothetical protein
MAPLLPWVLGALAALVALGPALQPGSLLNLDLVMTPDIPVPSGVWGLGPGLPRRMPLGLVLAWASPVVGGATAGKLLLGACVMGSFAGAWRLASATPLACRVGAGVLYALGPFTLTRLGVGHWGVLAAMAVLPWALPHLLRPGHDLRRTLLWGAALGATGITGGLYGAVVVATGLVCDRGRRAPGVVAAFAVGQLPWLVPGFIVLVSGPKLAQPTSFITSADGLLGPLRLVVGRGFWREVNQVGGDGGVGVLVLAAGLAVVAVTGARDLPPAWSKRAAVVAWLGFVASLASAVPGVSALYAAFTETALGGALREGQRMLPLFLVWLAPAVAAGTAQFARPLSRRTSGVALALPAAAGLALATPGLWGVNGSLEPVSFPPGWSEARAQVSRAPGTVLALPWYAYMDLGFASGRRVYNPVPDYLGGDVLVPSDLGLESPSEEQVDPRERQAGDIARRLRLGEPQSTALARLGVRWVVLLHEVDWRRYQVSPQDSGLEAVVQTPALELFRVRDWRGPFVDGRNEPVPSRSPVAPVVRLAASGPVTWERPAAVGWMRGTEAAGRTASGLVRLPAGSGLVWYWPAAVTLAADALTLAAVTVAARRLRSDRRQRNDRRAGDRPGQDRGEGPEPAPLAPLRA